MRIPHTAPLSTTGKQEMLLLTMTLIADETVISGGMVIGSDVMMSAAVSPVRCLKSRSLMIPTSRLSRQTSKCRIRCSHIMAATWHAGISGLTIINRFDISRRTWVLVPDKSSISRENR